LNACYKDNHFLDDEDIADYDRTYGSNSIWPESYIKQFVYGQFVDNNQDSLFIEMVTNATPKPGIKVAGYDCAYSGTGDDSVIVILDGNILKHIYVRKTKGDIEMKEFQNFVEALHKPDFWFYDATGNAVILKGQAINFSNSGGVYKNMRTKIYFDLKQKLRDGLHVPHEIMTTHWSAIKQELDATSLNMDRETKKPALIGKSEIKKIIGRSPDRADALALASIPPVSNVDYAHLRNLAVSNNPFRQR
jgi:hypothetical protein